MIKFDNKELYRRVDEVLFYIWDPIDVSPEPCARSEYTSYVCQMVDLVQNNDTIEPIAGYLTETVNNMIGLPANIDRCNYTAELLLRHKKAIIEGLG